ncbi:MAG: AbrB/MazE/SpoVT family DNA-binding domain-containing protein [Gammaproteobacteria bacterium]
MSIQLAKWGNALGVRIPAFVAKKAHLKPGDRVDFELLDSGEIMLKPVRKQRLTLEERVAEITDDNRHDETDWGDVQGQETW